MALSSVATIFGDSWAWCGFGCPIVLLDGSEADSGVNSQGCVTVTEKAANFDGAVAHWTGLAQVAHFADVAVSRSRELELQPRPMRGYQSAASRASAQKHIWAALQVQAQAVAYQDGSCSLRALTQQFVGVWAPAAPIGLAAVSDQESVSSAPARPAAFEPVALESFESFVLESSEQVPMGEVQSAWGPAGSP